MSRKSIFVGVIVVVSFMGMPAVTMAGGQVPAWTELVELDYQPIGGLASVETSLTKNTFMDWFSVDQRYPDGPVFETLVDYQGNPGPVVLDVTAASLDPYAGSNQPPGFVGLDVYSYAASAQPPQLDSPPTPVAFLGEFAVPTGDYSSSPFDITLTGTEIGGGVCFLLEVDDGVDHGDYPFVEGTAVPEPSSILTIVLGLGGVAVACASRWVRGRFSGDARGSVAGNLSKPRWG